MALPAGPVLIAASASPHLYPLPELGDDRLTNEQGRGQFGAFSWPHRFFQQQPISRNWENSPWITAVLKITSEALEESEPGEDNIFFLKTEDNWAADKHRVAPLVAFLQSATLSQLQKGIGIPDTNIAILIDGNIFQGEVHFRPYLGSLSASRLLEGLQKKRYNENVSGMEEEFIDAERRLIYVVDLSRWGVLALVGSAPESLYRVLDDFVLNYILSRPSIGVHFSTEGPETFALEFSFPYWVWRTSHTLVRDHRCFNSDEESLRSSLDMTFLRNLAGSRIDDGDIDTVYSTHISCIITGYDQSRWTGILFCEAWFEVEIPGGPTPDNIERYEGELQDLQDNLGVVELSDPLCRGKNAMFTSTPTMWLPRFYFIRVLRIRLGQIHQESMGLYNNVDMQIKGVVKRHKHLLQRMHDYARRIEAATTWDDFLNEFDDFEEQILHAKQIVKKLASTMEEVVSSGDSFMTTDVNYFLNTEGRSGDTSDCYPFLSQIRKTFNDLRQLRQRFGCLQEQCEDMMEECLVAKQKSLLRIKLSAAQPAAASTTASVPTPTGVVPHQPIEVRVLSWITIISQPLVNTAAVFGCDDIITFSRTPGNFVLCLALMCLGMAAIVLIWTRLVNGKWPCGTHFRTPDAAIGTCSTHRDSHEETVIVMKSTSSSPADT